MDIKQIKKITVKTGRDKGGNSVPVRDSVTESAYDIRSFVPHPLTISPTYIMDIKQIRKITVKTGRDKDGSPFPSVNPGQSPLTTATYHGHQANQENHG